VSFENFTPPDFNVPNGISNGPSSRESINNKALQVAKTSRNVRTVTSQIIATRSALKNHLIQFNLKLITSSVEFDTSGSFINSSYIEYLNHQSYREKFTSFLQRYPQFQQVAMQIDSQLQSLKGKMNINQYEQIFN
jgi:hypothetical protein